MKDTLDKRIVLEHRAGRLKGVYSIMGLASEAPTPLPGAPPLPEFVESVDCRDHQAPACLVTVKRSYVLYQEVITPEMQHGKEFNRSQR